ncbi:MAG: hypothetical protein Q7V31_02925 [Parvibaculum sp.]|uniref:hypothetical protein n=1 Tax=Parvibaculum sp. TaxID=2024848 RepID=UPI0027286110|nr:hypothetical protein [Parvibaculum sp.]MDO8837855.1 hypothetical protein [Parvibaculum sp.]
MSKIERITRSQMMLPAPQRQAEVDARAQRTEPTIRALDARAPGQSHAALGRPPLGVTRPVAGFLAQYVDQHWHWPYSPSRKQEKRRRAAMAYIDADTLPDSLAEALRLPRLELKL